jgi:hypothetical protein
MSTCGSRRTPGSCSRTPAGVGYDDMLYFEAIIERIPLMQIVRRTIAFCDHHRPDFVSIEVEQFQEFLVHAFCRRSGDRFNLLTWEMRSQGISRSHGFAGCRRRSAAASSASAPTRPAAGG